MAKYYGIVGFAEYGETAPDVWEDIIVERYYAGEVIKNNNRNINGEYLNDDLTLSNRISIVCDPYAQEHFHSIKYCVWMNSKWRVKSVEVSYPRLNLELGGVYGEQDEA